jgi:hypothetical protein
VQGDARGHQRSVAREADQHQALVGVEPEQVRDQLHDLAWAADLEAGSVRDGRVDWYLELAAHSFGDRRSDLLLHHEGPGAG